MFEENPSSCVNVFSYEVQRVPISGLVCPIEDFQVCSR